MSSITLLAGKSGEVAAVGKVGLLCETAPDGSLRTRFPDAVGLRELLGDINETKDRAYGIVNRLVAEEPRFRGVQQLRVFEEVLIRATESAIDVLNLIDWLKGNRITHCEIVGVHWLSKYLSVLASETGIDIRVPPPSKGGGPLVQTMGRIYGRLRDSSFSRASLHQEWRQVLDRIDPYRRRHALNRQRRRWAGDIWFYTTSYTFTRIALAYEPYFPAPFEFLVENPSTGGAPLREDSRRWVSLYEFSAADLAPSRREIDNAADAIEQHLRSVPLSSRDSRARDIVMESWISTEFRERLLPRGLYQTRLFDEWAERTRPAALVIGNPVFEAYALLAARKRGIPTVLLQHGILGDYCQFVDPPVDCYIVRGTFWQDFLADGPRKRSKVLNIPDKTEKAPRAAMRREAILFLTAPYSLQRLWPESELDDIIQVLLRCAVERRAELIIRAHPTDKVGIYQRRVNAIMTEEGKRIASIRYSQGGDLDDILARSAVAVTYSSTVFLECLRWQVPLVSFDWHHFSYKEKISNYGVFYFARSNAELRVLVLRALTGGLDPFRDGVGPFVAATSEEEARRDLAAAIQPHAQSKNSSRRSKPNTFGASPR
jgi:hypothetical protein